MGDRGRRIAQKLAVLLSLECAEASRRESLKVQTKNQLLNVDFHMWPVCIPIHTYVTHMQAFVNKGGKSGKASLD